MKVHQNRKVKDFLIEVFVQTFVKSGTSSLSIRTEFEFTATSRLRFSLRFLSKVVFLSTSFTSKSEIHRLPNRGFRFNSHQK